MEAPGARSWISRAQTKVSAAPAALNSLMLTSLSPEPALRKMSKRPLSGAPTLCAACTRKKAWTGGAARAETKQAEEQRARNSAHEPVAPRRRKNMGDFTPES